MLECQGGDPPITERVEELRRLINQAEQAVQPYLKECACCFAAGAYSATIVVGWCAVAKYLKMGLEAIGVSVAPRFYQNEAKPDHVPMDPCRLSDRQCITTYTKMKLLDEDKMASLKSFYDTRCRFAHASGETAQQQEAFQLVVGARWLLARRVSQEQFQHWNIVMDYAEDSRVAFTEDVARRLILRVRQGDCEELGHHVLRSYIARGQDHDCDKEMALRQRLLRLWNALKLRVSGEGRKNLMDNLAKSLRSDVVNTSQRYQIDDVLDVQLVAQHLLLWPEAAEHDAIRTYLDARWGGLTDNIRSVISSNLDSRNVGQEPGSRR
ncbi:MAG: hypothetical protein L0Z68_10340 [Gammaproteobacteria bacterium]|nr:hypothetical protein [Gammaproteobacteria bacterium]